MKMLLSTFKWMLLLIIGLPLVIYIFLILLNINDEAKSTKVIEFEQLLSHKSTLNDKKNGFVYAAGLTSN
jgi:hypothetical protein